MRFNELEHLKMLFLTILARNVDEERYSVAFGVVLVVRGNRVPEARRRYSVTRRSSAV